MIKIKEQLSTKEEFECYYCDRNVFEEDSQVIYVPCDIDDVEGVVICDICAEEYAERREHVFREN